MAFNNTPLFNRDLSWLTFNERVLDMAADERVPLYERIRFLSIYSSNLDEFFRVRMPAMLAIHRLREQAGKENAHLGEVLALIQQQQEKYGQLLREQLLPALKAQQIHVHYNTTLPERHAGALKSYFLNTVLAYMQPVWLHHAATFFPENNALYLAVALSPLDQPRQQQYAIVNIPEALPRFHTLPDGQGGYDILFLDDIIREQLPYLFPRHEVLQAWCLKITRNAEMDMDEFKGDILEEVETLIRKRELGVPTRFLYDAAMPAPLQQLLAAQFQIQQDEMVAGGRYHNLKDLAGLPMPLPLPAAVYPKQQPAGVPALRDADRLLPLIQQQDVLIHLPYQQYDYILRFFSEAAADPDTEEIYVTLYRIASGSQIAQALISAARNGKRVTVFVELKARFDEANNIRWSKRMKEAGVKIVYSIPGMKVHAKVALVKRRQGYRYDYSGLLATGNFNESTARFYTDHVLFTAHAGITREMELLFLYLQSREQPAGYAFLQFKHLLVAQFNIISRFRELIEREIAHAKAGRKAHITIKLNNLQEEEMIGLLYAASEAGVQIDLIVRSICCLVPDQPQSSTIRVRRIVDRYLEHARVFLFHNNGEEEVYMGSADWMNRNLHRRIEVCFPVYDPQLAQQLKDILQLQLADNTNAVRLDAGLQNIPITATEGEKQVNTQQATQAYVQHLANIM